jgi:DNA-binding transcriptional LysR family regulator
MPLPMVEEDLANGKLVSIELEQFKSMKWAFAMRALHRKDSPPGPAGRWFINCLKQLS